MMMVSLSSRLAAFTFRAPGSAQRFGQSVIHPKFGQGEDVQAGDIDYKALAAQTTVQRRGHSTSGRVLFRLELDRVIEGLDTSKLQNQLGYPPMGYDHFSGPTQVLDSATGKYVTTFSCAASCD